MEEEEDSRRASPTVNLRCKEVKGGWRDKGQKSHFLFTKKSESFNILLLYLMV